MLISMFDMQHWKCNNIYNTWKKKENLKSCAVYLLHKNVFKTYLRVILMQVINP